MKVDFIISLEFHVVTIDYALIVGIVIDYPVDGAARLCPGIRLAVVEYASGRKPYGNIDVS